MRRSLLIITLTLLASAATLRAAEPYPPPTAVRAAWTADRTARLSWVQQSSANMVCLSSSSGTGNAQNALKICIPGGTEGPRAFDLAETHYTQGFFEPAAGDGYFITEWQIASGAGGPTQQFYGRYGPFVLPPHEVRLPLIVR